MKIDIERLLCSLIECNTKSEHKYNWLADVIITSLRDQGLIYKDGQITPKLRESEDDRIRKEIIDFLELPHPQFVGKRDHKTWIAWLEKQGDASRTYELGFTEGQRIERKRRLEKQGEQKPNPYSGTSFAYNGHTWGMCARDNGVEILLDGELKAFLSLEKSFIYPIHPQPELAPKSALEAAKEEKVDNQNCVKPANKIEPKFKVGDWVVHDMSDGRVSPPTQIVDITNKSYVFDTEECFYFSDAEEAFRKWTIQDANDGDVLAAKSGNRIFLYNGNCDLRHRPCAYCGTYKGFSEILFSKCAIGNYFTDEDVYPATKKQRNLLFQKMKESGYEWDAEKKELKEIEQKPAWSEEDEKIRKALIRFHKSTIEVDGIKGDDIVAWLEKQGEKDKLIKELGEYKVKYTQEVLKKTYK